MAVTDQRDELVTSVFDSELHALRFGFNNDRGARRTSLLPTDTLRLVKAMRGLLLSRCAAPIPEWISGHRPSRAPTRAPHLAIAPLPDTPFIFDSSSKSEADRRTDVQRACARIGLPAPEDIRIATASSLGAIGVPPADRFPPAKRNTASRFHQHLTLTFSEAIRGPVLLGAGRYHGCGLCLPLDGATPPAGGR